MINEHEITINKLELASELADTKVVDMVEEGIYCNNDIYKESESEMTYTEIGQDLFNEWYDHYLNLIESCKK
jgi:hypothetical protein